MHSLSKYIFVLGAIWLAAPNEDLDSVVDRGNTLLRNDSPDAAAESFRAVLATQTDHTDALRGLVLAGLHPETDDALAKEALDAARRLMTLDPSDRTALDQWSQLHARLTGAGERRFREPWNPLGPPAVPMKAGERPAQIHHGDGESLDIFINVIETDSTASLGERDYRGRLAGAVASGANAVRVARLMSPDFYRALAAHNRETDTPLFLIQGVWSKLSPEGESCDPDPDAGIDDQIKRVIDAVHGNLVLSPRSCHVSGVYDTDVSSRLLAYAIGPEWEIFILDRDDLAHDGAASCEGTWFRTDDPRPIECAVVEISDQAVGYEARSYGVIHPVSFLNWSTLEPLSIRPTPEMEAGILTLTGGS